MNTLSHWLSTPLRRWRTLGFGVHSPFAFEFVTKTVGERCEYYAYDTLRALGDDRPAELLLIFRCALAFLPPTVSVDDPDSPVARAIRAANSRLAVIGHDPGLRPAMSVIENCDTDTGADIIIVRNIDRGNRALWRRITSSMTSGMTFTDRRIGIACRLPHLPRQSFKIDVR